MSAQSHARTNRRHLHALRAGALVGYRGLLSPHAGHLQNHQQLPARRALAEPGLLSGFERVGDGAESTAAHPSAAPAGGAV